jgi:sugar lactone lactonase YvrE
VIVRQLSYLLVFSLCALAGSAQTATITTFAGSTSGGGYVDAQGASARFSLPRGIAVDASGTLFVADAANHVIRRVTSDGQVTTFAGSAANPGFADGTGIAARFRVPWGLVFGADGSLYVSDKDNHVIRRITPLGQVTTFAGMAGSAGTEDGAGAARFTFPRGLAVDGSDNIYVADSGNSVIRKITPQGAVTTLAGAKRVRGSSDGFGDQARLDTPYDVAYETSTGNLYVADFENNNIRKVTPEGRVTTVAGDAGQEGDFADGTGTAARFNAPTGLEIDADGNVYVADLFNNRIRRITPAAVVTTLAGSGFSGARDGSPGAARFHNPSGIALSNGQLYIGDAFNHAIRIVTLAGDVTTLAGSMPANGTVSGNGTLARFHFPNDVAVDAAGNIYVADSSPTIRRITPQGVVTTLAGTANGVGTQDGTGSAARFNFPAGITIDPNGNMFVADTNNHTIRKITPGGVVTTFAGLGGVAGDQDGTGSQARFDSPWDVVSDSRGNLYVADTFNNKIRMIEPSGVVTTFAGSGAFGDDDGIGTGASFIYPISITVDAARNLYVSDWGNDTIRKITQGGVVTTVAGSSLAAESADGIGSAARFNSPYGIVSDAAGNLYVADTDNHTLRRVTAAGVVTTIAGLPFTPGNVDGTGSAARFFFPQGLALGPGGQIVIADAYNHAIRIAALSGERRRSVRH